MEKLLFESDGKNISENKKKIGRKLGVIFLIAGGIGFLLFGNMYSNFYGENRFPFPITLFFYKINSP